MKPGDLVAGRFEIHALAGIGGMGRVYRASDRETGAAVAVKVLVDDGRHAARFAREAELLERLRHPAIVRHVAHGTTPDGDAFLVMEWLDGEDLSARLTRGPLSVPETLALARRALGGLAVAHAMGVVHRDLKPSNIYLEGASVERAKLLDFGVAHLSDAALTRTGAVLGTPGYMAPEQVRGDRGVDGRADLFALGCVLYECLAGAPAFRGGASAAVFAKILFDDPPRLSSRCEGIPPRLDAIITQSLAKNPHDRPADVAAFDRALGDVDLDRALAATPVRPRALTEREQRRLYVVVAVPPAQSSVATADLEAPVDPNALRRRLKSDASRFGAELELLADGTVVATLGGVGSATDQAAAAARCALALREALPDTPLAVATGSGVLQGASPAGEVIEHAVSLLRGTPSGIRTDAATAALLGAHFDLGEDATGIELKRERDAAPGGRTLLGRPSPCVGRERELGFLDSLFRECADEELARAVVVLAPPGVGKSRLMREFLARVERDDRPAEVWIARGDPMSAGSPFGMLAQVVRRAAGILEAEPPAARAKKLKDRVRRSVPTKSAGRVGEFLAELAGAAAGDEAPSPELRAARSDAMRMGEQMRRAFVDLVAAECASRPVLIVLEDLHWGDAATVKALDEALRGLHDRRLMVLALARPEARELFPKLWAGRSLTEVELGGLSRKAGERLARAMLGDATPSDVLDAVVSRAAGNAFYLEELIRAVAEGRGTELPDTVLAMVDARLDALEPEARRALRAASVFGEAFWTAGVAELLGATSAPGALAATLTELVDREVIEQHPQGRFPAQDEYIFRHGLVREAAYRRLTDADRALGHGLAGAWLERAGEADASVLAEHFDRGRAPDRAVPYYVRAGQDVLAGASFERAITVAGRGLSCGAAGLDRGLLRLVECEAHVMRFELAECERAGTEALALLARASGHWFGALGAVSMASAALGHRERAASLLGDLLGTEPDPGAVVSCVMGYCWATMTLSCSGLYPAAEGLCERAEGLCDRVAPDDRAVAAFVAQSRYWAASTEDDPWKRLQLARGAAALRDEVGYSGFVARAYADLGTSLHGVGAYADAVRAFTHALDLAVPTGMAYATTFLKLHLGATLFEQGRADEAEVLLQESEAACVKSTERYYLGRARVQLARVRMQRGDYAGAEEALRTVTEPMQSRPLRAYAHAVLAEALLAQGRAEEALAQAKEGRRLFTALGAVHEGDACIHLAWAEALAATGAHDAARGALDAARERLLARAAKIEDAETRRSFVKDVPDHVRTLARADAR